MLLSFRDTTVITSFHLSVSFLRGCNDRLTSIDCFRLNGPSGDQHTIEIGLKNAAIIQMNLKLLMLNLERMQFGPSPELCSRGLKPASTFTYRSPFQTHEKCGQ